MADEPKTDSAQQAAPTAPAADQTTGTAPDKKPEANAAAPTTPAQTAKPITFESEQALQAHIDAILKDRLDRKEKQLAEREGKARREAEEKALAEQGKFKELAEQRAVELADAQTRLKDLDAAQAEVKRLTKALAEQVAAQTKDLPDYLRDLLASKDPIAQMEWLTANREKLAPKPAPATLNGAARGNGAGKMSDQEASELAAIYGVRREYMPK